MNRFFVITVVAASAVGCTAQDRERPREGGPGGPGMGPGMMRFNPLLAALDADHDGVISAAEIKNAAAALRTLDKNGDGQLTAEEMRPQRPQGRQEGRGEGPPGGGGQGPDEMVKMLMAFDKNGDGKLSKDEVPERMQGLFARADANKDGFLTPDEIRKVAQAQMAQGDGPRGDRGERRAGGPGGPEGRPGGFPPNPIMEALDKNHDGVLSAEEIRNAPAALKTLDKNGDGQLTMDELRPPRPPQREDRE